MIISDELFFSDRVVLKVYGGIPALLEQELAEILIRGGGVNSGPGRTPAQDRSAGRLLLSPAPVTGFLEVPPIFNNPKRLMNYMDQLMHREILACGVSLAQLRLLQEVYRGRGRLSALCGRLNTQEKQIWQDKYRLLVKLGMRNRLRNCCLVPGFVNHCSELRLSLRNNRLRRPYPETLTLRLNPVAVGHVLPVV